MGGKAATLVPEQVARNCPDLDIVVTGDQEGVFEEVLDYVTSQRWSGIRGITYRQQGKVHTNPPRMGVDLESLPPLNYSFIPLTRYFAASPLPYSVEARAALMSAISMSAISLTELPTDAACTGRPTSSGSSQP